MNEFNAAVLEVSSADWSLLPEFLAVILVCNAVADSSHFFHPVLVLNFVSGMSP